MTAYEIFLSCIPIIAKMITECQRMQVQEYAEWKQKTLEAVPEEIKFLTVKVLAVMDTFVLAGKEDSF